MKPWQPKPHDQDVKEWSYQFMNEVGFNPSARWAWRRIQRAGIPDKAAIGLFLYRSGTEPDQAVARYFVETHELTREAARKLNEAAHLQQLEGRRTPKSPHSRGRPRKPAKDALDEARESPWGEGSTTTVGSTIARYERETSRQLTITQYRRVLVKSGGARSAMNSRLCLAALQELARDHGLALGYKSIKALAECAAPNVELDDRHLQRSLKRARGIVREIVDRWERVSLRRESFPHLFANHK